MVLIVTYHDVFLYKNPSPLTGRSSILQISLEYCIYLRPPRTPLNISCCLYSTVSIFIIHILLFLPDSRVISRHLSASKFFSILLSFCSSCCSASSFSTLSLCILYPTIPELISFPSWGARGSDASLPPKPSREAHCYDWSCLLYTSRCV